MQLGSVMLHGYAGQVDPFIGLAVSAVNGWRGLPGARGENDAIPGAHGSYSAASILREERSIEVRGAAVAESEAEALALIDALEAETAGRPVDMWVHDSQGAWRRSVEVQAVQIVGAYNRRRVQFAVDAIAPDPRRYRAIQQAGPIGLPVLVGGLVLPEAMPWNFGTQEQRPIELLNDGTVPLLPTIRVDGAASSVVVRAGSYRLAFGSFDGSLTFDSLNRRAFLNGYDVTRNMLARGWPVIESGQGAVIDFSATDAQPGLTLAVSYEIGAW